MTTALYRRYRPENFDEVIGQEHVTEPLKAALASGRVTHAYLFSGPRGCGKTTSARIFARCLNCAKGPTPTPCGECDSCKELSRGGSGSLDVVEIDAASHNGVDDARELRERAAFAPVRDRYKIFILDEAHMVTTQGFNALLKLVEEPPEHVKFIFATTEPEKVIGTIRSRTHHYPFRLVPPETLLRYLAQLGVEEHVKVASGVLPMVVRAGAGSVRDSLSVLDQLIAGAREGEISYPVAAELLGFTSSTLLDDAVDALAGHDGAALFRVVDDAVSSGHDPRRFVEDLLQRLRDLLILAIAGDAGAKALGALPQDQLEAMHAQAARLGAAAASRAADLTHEALNAMVGATSPRLQLELLCARLVLPSAAAATAGVPAAAGTAAAASPSVPVAQQRVAQPGGSATVSSPAPSSPTAVETAPPASDSAAASVEAPALRSAAAPASGEGAAAATKPAAGGGDAAATTRPAAAAAASTAPAVTKPAAAGHEKATTAAPASNVRAAAAALRDSEPGGSAKPAASSAGNSAASGEAPADEPAAAGTSPTGSDTSPTGASTGPAAAAISPTGSASVDSTMLRRRWGEVLETIARIRRASWVLVSQHAAVGELSASTLVLIFESPGLVSTFQSGRHNEIVAQALQETLGLSVVVRGAMGDAPKQAATTPQEAAPAVTPTAPPAARVSAAAAAPEPAQAQSATASSEGSTAPAASKPMAKKPTEELPAPKNAASEAAADDDVMSPDDPDAAESGTVGITVIEQVLGGKIVGEESR